MSDLEIERLRGPEARAFHKMTFPAYRHMLSLEPAPRHPEQGDTEPEQPVAVAARNGSTATGLALGALPDSPEKPAEILSLYTLKAARGRGVATRMLGRLEEELRAEGAEVVEAVYMTGKDSIAAVERILEKRGWSEPEARTVTLKFTPEQALATPWFGRVRLSDDYEIFPWTELTEEERLELQRTQAESGWIAAGLEPWKHDARGFDPVSSLGLRYEGDVVGWVINHRLSPRRVRFTCSYMRKDLGRRGRILPLFTRSLEALREEGCEECMFVTPVSYDTMVRFVRRRCAKWASFFGETRGSRKILAEPGTFDEVAGP